MNSYGDFAYLYDRLIDEDYEKWANFLEGCFKKYGANISLVLDLACGTGSITTLLAKRGYDMIGLDGSCDMLNIAAEKSEGLSIQYILQDMTEFELYGTVDAIICTLDGMNYITDPAKLERVFRLAHNYLNPGGLFVFDVNSRYKIENILGNRCYVTDLEEVFYTWENFYNEETKICSYNLTFFVENGGKYERVDEYQEQRAHSREELEQSLAKAGLSVINCFDGISFAEGCETSERLMFVTQKPMA